MTEALASRRELLDTIRARLAAAGVSDPVRESRWIWERVSGETSAGTVSRWDEEVSPELAVAVQTLVTRRAQGEPLAYVLGETSFRWLTIQCDRRALIPRPETEGLIDLVLARRPAGCAVDVGTGTGCLALSLAREGSFDRVVAIDRSSEALGLAAANSARLGISLQLVRGNLTEALGPASVDVVVSNPPYLSQAEYAKLDDSVRSWEPAIALMSGDDGMEATRRLLYDGRRVLRPAGLLAVEVDSARASNAAQMAADAGWVDIIVLDDLFGRARYLLARRSEES